MITVILPYPPSANRLWRNGKGVTYKSAEYVAWLAEAQAAIPMQARGQIRGPHSVLIEVDRPSRALRDIDNRAKPIMDSLKDQKYLKGVIRDDSDTVQITIRWTGAEPVKPALVRVTVTPEKM